MTETDALIAKLSSDTEPPRTLRAPFTQAVWLLLVLACYGVGVQFMLGFRQDLVLRFRDLFFLSEVIVLASVLFSSVVASIIAMYPDAYQKRYLLHVPHCLLVVLLCILGWQLCREQGVAPVQRDGGHALECALCIASIAFIPSVLLFGVLRSGATVSQCQAGGFAVLAASMIGCLTLRFAEASDSMVHLVVWHYIPTLLFAACGALVGKWILKWR